MSRETIFVMDVDTEFAVLAHNWSHAEHYRNLWGTDYTVVTFGVNGGFYTFGTFSEEEAEKVAEEVNGKILRIKWDKVYFRIDRQYPFIVLSEKKTKGAEKAKLLKVLGRTTLCRNLQPVLDSILNEVGLAEVDYEGILPYDIRIGRLCVRRTRYNTGVFLRIDEAGLPVVGFGKYHLSVSESTTSPTPAVYAGKMSILCKLLKEEWTSYGYGYVEVTDEPHDDAVISVNVDGKYHNFHSPKVRG